MNRYCVWCEEAIIGKKSRNKMYCSKQCFNEQHTANNHNEGLGPKDYREHPNGAREQGIPEGGLPWEVQHTLDLEEDSSRITEDTHYILSCMSSLPQPKYSDGTSYQHKSQGWNPETNGSKVKKDE